MGDEAVLVDAALRVAGSHHGGTADEAEFLVPCGLRLQRALLGDAFDIAQCEKSAQAVLFVHDEEFVDADVLGEKLVRPRDGIGAEFILANRENPGARHHRLRHAARGEAGTHAMARQQPEEAILGIDNGKGREAEFFLFDQSEHIADPLIGVDFDRLADEAVDMVFHARDLRELLLRRHVVVDQPETAIQRQRDRHTRFGDGIHVRGNHRQVERQTGGDAGFEVRLARHDLAVKRGEGHIVVGERNRGVGWEKLFCRPVEERIKVRGGGRFLRWAFHDPYSGKAFF